MKYLILCRCGELNVVVQLSINPFMVSFCLKVSGFCLPLKKKVYTYTFCMDPNGFDCLNFQCVVAHLCVMS